MVWLVLVVVAVLLGLAVLMITILILLGVALIALSVLTWLGMLTPAVPELSGATGYDVLLELVRKVPWVALVGLFLVYAGLKCLGVSVLGK